MVASDDGRTGTDSNSPFYSVVLATLSEGSRAVTATVYDVAGNSYSTGGLAVTVDRTPPSATVPDLNAGSDTGRFNNDDVTQGLNPRFDGAANDDRSGVSKVMLNSDDGRSGTDSSPPFYSVVLPTLGEGNRTVAATVYDVAGNSHTTSGLSVTVDRTGARVTAFGLASTDWRWTLGTVASSVWTSGRSERTAPWSVIDVLALGFDEPVLADPADLQMTGVTHGIVGFSGPDPTTPPPADQLSWSVTSGTPNGYLGNDRYAVILHDTVEDLAGNTLDGGDWTFDLNVLIGDINGDGVVNVLDKAQVRLHYGDTLPVAVTAALVADADLDRGVGLDGFLRWQPDLDEPVGSAQVAVAAASGIPVELQGAEASSLKADVNGPAVGAELVLPVLPEITTALVGKAIPSRAAATDAAAMVLQKRAYVRHALATTRPAVPAMEGMAGVQQEHDEAAELDLPVDLLDLTQASPAPPSQNDTEAQMSSATVGRTAHAAGARWIALDSVLAALEPLMFPVLDPLRR